ncbi:DUF1801 domain-containing protein [Phenylobacterium sp. VNQ135]|uniref:DUF1801 domain-containing protein n=1 Tax=Phenylobacterium sp. VNQ135 TaxID=3400922 RepID=UPI003BFAAFBC
MAEIKTKPTAMTVDQFIDGLESDRRREEARVIAELMARVTGEPATMWGASIIGFGSYAYRYESGHGGRMCKVGFSPRKAAISLYLTCDAERLSEHLARLGKTTHGKGCIYVKKLSDIDLSVLEEMTAEAVAWTDRTYPAA